MAFKSFGQNILQMRQQALQEKMHQDRMRQYEEDRSARKTGMGLNMLSSVISNLTNIGTALYQSDQRASTAKAKAEADWKKKIAEMVMQTGIKPKEELAAESAYKQAVATQQAKQKAADALAAQQPQAVEKVRREEPLLTRGGMRTGVESESIPRRRLETKPTSPAPEFGEKERVPMGKPLFKPGPPELAPERFSREPESAKLQTHLMDVEELEKYVADQDRLKERTQEEEQRTVKYELPEAVREEVERPAKEAKKEVDVARRAVRIARHALQVARQDPLSRAATVVRAEKQLESQEKALTLALKKIEYDQRFEESKRKTLRAINKQDRIELQWFPRKGKGKDKSDGTYRVKSFPLGGEIWVPVQGKDGFWKAEKRKIDEASFIEKMNSMKRSKPGGRGTPPPKGDEGAYEQIIIRWKEQNKVGAPCQTGGLIKSPKSKKLEAVVKKLKGSDLLAFSKATYRQTATRKAMALQQMPFETKEDKKRFNAAVKELRVWLENKWVDAKGKKEREKYADRVNSLRDNLINQQSKAQEALKDKAEKSKRPDKTITVDGRPIIVYSAAVGAAGLGAYLSGKAPANPLTGLSYENAKKKRDSAEFAKWLDYKHLVAKFGPAKDYIKKATNTRKARTWKSEAKRLWEKAGLPEGEFESYWGTPQKPGTGRRPNVTQLLPSGPGETRLPSQSPRQRMSQDLAFVSASAPEPIAEFHKINSQNWPASKKRRVWEHMARSRGWVAQGERVVG